MILAVAERVNDPAIPDERVERWRMIWHEHRLGAIRMTPAMTRGGTLARLRNLIGVRPERVMNLLWPDNKIGTWDMAEARLSAIVLRDWLERDRQNVTPQVSGVVLLGKRVVEAFALQNEGWGEVVDGGDLPPILLMPHPSGRNRLLNDPEFCARLRSRAALFVQLTEV